LDATDRRLRGAVSTERKSEQLYNNGKRHLEHLLSYTCFSPSPPPTQPPTTSFIPTSTTPTTTVAASTSVSSPPQTPSTSPCLFSIPPGFQCSNGQLQAQGNQTITQSVLNTTVPIVVNGSLTTLPNTTIVAVYQGSPVLNVSGVTNLQGTLQLVVPNSGGVSTGTRLVIGYTPNMPTNLFTKVNVSSSSDACFVATGTPDYSSSDSSLGVLITSVSSQCGRNSSGFAWWIYLVIVLATLLLVGVSIFLLWYILKYTSCCRWLFREGTVLEL